MTQNNKNSPDDEEVDLLEYWRALVKHKKLISAIIASTFILSVTISFLLPKIYSASASVMPQQQENSLGASMAASLSGGLGIGFLGIKSQTDTWIGILQSQNVRDEVIRRFNLREIYGTDTIEQTRNALDKAVTIDKSKEDVITVIVEDKNPERTADMANAFIEELDRVNREVVMTSGKRTRSFIEKRLAEARTELAKAEDEIKAFQQKNKAVKLDDQSKAIIEVLGSVKGQLMAKEVELQILLSYAADTNPHVDLLRTEINGLKSQLNILEKGSPGHKDIFIPTDKYPEISLQFGRLIRNAKVQETLFELLTQQYEMARIQEAQDSPTVQVLDKGKVPEKKSKPKRGLIIGISMLLALFFSIGWVIFIEYFNRSRRSVDA